MKHKIIIEIDGVRHRLVRGRYVPGKDYCDKCSLEKECAAIIGEPCLHVSDYFVKEGEK